MANRILWCIAWVLTLATMALAGYTVGRPEVPRCVESYELGVEDTPELRLYVYSLGGCFRSRLTDADPEAVGLIRDPGAYALPWDR